jgi:hypothetical protein
MPAIVRFDVPMQGPHPGVNVMRARVFDIDEQPAEPARGPLG